MFANLGGFSRADAVVVVPETAEAQTRFNRCVQVASAGSSIRRIIGLDGRILTVQSFVLAVGILYALGISI
jgi:hypothetical protein